MLCEQRLSNRRPALQALPCACSATSSMKSQPRLARRERDGPPIERARAHMHRTSPGSTSPRQQFRTHPSHRIRTRGSERGVVVGAVPGRHVSARVQRPSGCGARILRNITPLHTLRSRGRRRAISRRRDPSRSTPCQPQVVRPKRFRPAAQAAAAPRDVERGARTRGLWRLAPGQLRRLPRTRRARRRPPMDQRAREAKP